MRLAGDAPAPIRFLNLGGGFGVPYFPGEQRLDLAPIGANLAQLLERAKTEMPQAGFVIELGRYLVAEAGIYVTRILDRKVSRGHVFLVTDGGLNHHLSASGNLARWCARTTRSRSATGPTQARPRWCRWSGRCARRSIAADRMALPPAREGDLVVVYQSGAYGASASPQAFLGHGPRVEVRYSPSFPHARQRVRRCAALAVAASHGRVVRRVGGPSKGRNGCRFAV